MDDGEMTFVYIHHTTTTFLSEFPKFNVVHF